MKKIAVISLLFLSFLFSSYSINDAQAGSDSGKEVNATQQHFLSKDKVRVVLVLSGACVFIGAAISVVYRIAKNNPSKEV